MNRRGFLGKLAATAAGLMVPAYLGRSHVALNQVQAWDMGSGPDETVLSLWAKDRGIPFVEATIPRMQMSVDGFGAAPEVGDYIKGADGERYGRIVSIQVQPGQRFIRMKAQMESVEAQIRRDLTKHLAESLDKQFLEGMGGGKEPAGMFSVGFKPAMGIQESADGETWQDIEVSGEVRPAEGKAWNMDALDAMLGLAQ